MNYFADSFKQSFTCSESVFQTFIRMISGTALKLKIHLCVDSRHSCVQRGVIYYALMVLCCFRWLLVASSISLIALSLAQWPRASEYIRNKGPL